jgi:hypothetical protein
MDNLHKQIAREILDAITLEAGDDYELFARFVPMFGSIVVLERIPLIDPKEGWPKPEPWPSYSCSIPLNALANGEISIGGKNSDTNHKVAYLLQGVANKYNLRINVR